MKLLICTQAVDKNHPILGFFHGWIEEFSQHFNEVHVICLIKGEYELPPHVHVYSLGKEEGESRLKYLFRFYRFFGHIFFKIKVDFVFYHMGAVYNIIGAPFFFLRRLYGTKFYWWKTHGIINYLGKLALVFVDKIFTAGSKSFSIKTEKLFVVGHAIDTEHFTMRKVKHSKLCALAVGRVVPIKELEYTIQIVHLLNQQNIAIDLRIVGPTEDYEYVSKLKLLCDKLHIANQVTFVGSVSQQEILSEYALADFLIHPSVKAGFDKVILEAMSSGVIPLTSTPSFESLLSQYQLYMSSHEIQSYVSRISELVKDSKEKLCALSDELRMIVVREHSLATLSKRIFNI